MTSSFALNAPITTLQTTQACPNTNTTVNITASNFINIGAISLTFTYDPSVLTIQLGSSTSNPLLPGPLINSVPVGGASPLYKVIIAWYTTMSPVDLPNGSTLFTLTFHYTSGTSALVFDNVSDFSSDCEYGNEFGVLMNDSPTSTYYVNGQVGLMVINPVLQTLPPICSDTTAFQLHNGTPVGGTYTGTGISSNMLNPSIAGLGMHTYTYTYSMGPGCSGSTTAQYQVVQRSGIQGTVRYDNASSTLIDSVRVRLLKNSQIIDSSLSNNLGYYSMHCVNNGTYTFSPLGKKKWGGVNATDALIIARFSVNLQPLTAFKQKVGDVNNSGSLTAADSYIIMRRFVGIVNTFTIKDWIFANVPPITVSSVIPVTQNFLTACAGDVDGSYPGGAKSGEVQVYEGIFADDPDQIVTLPVTLSCPANVSAISLKISFPGAIHFSAFETPLSDALISEDEESLSFAWYNIDGISNPNKQILFNLKGRAGDMASLPGSPAFRETEIEVADQSGNILNNYSISIPRIIFNNPFQVSTKGLISQGSPLEVNVEVSQPGKIILSLYDMMGNEVQNISMNNITSGLHHYNIETHTLSRGMYIIRGRMQYKEKADEKSCKFIVD
jgi:hypothetical protein